MNIFKTKKTKKRKPKVVTAKDVYIKLECNLTPQKQEEYELAKELGLHKQAEAVKLEGYGFSMVRRADFRRLLKVDENVGLSCYELDKFLGKIPMGVMCRIKEVQEKNIFDMLHIIAPSENSGEDPLLIGEKFTEYDSNSNSYGHDPKIGNRADGFFRRDTILMLITQWE